MRVELLKSVWGVHNSLIAPTWDLTRSSHPRSNNLYVGYLIWGPNIGKSLIGMSVILISCKEINFGPNSTPKFSLWGEDDSNPYKESIIPSSHNVGLKKPNIHYLRLVFVDSTLNKYYIKGVSLNSSLKCFYYCIFHIRRWELIIKLHGISKVFLKFCMYIYKFWTFWNYG